MLFEKSHRDANARNQKLYASFAILYPGVDFAAALFFIIGSIMIFSEDWIRTGSWLFLIGAVCFAIKPALRVIRELKLAANKDTEELAKRFEN